MGLAGALAAAGVMRRMLFGIRPYDPATFVVVTALTLLVVVLARVVPARRASRLPPSDALRAE